MISLPVRPRLPALLLALVLATAGCKDNQAKLIHDHSAEICANNLRHIESAKEIWAQRTGAAKGATPTWDDIAFQFNHGLPECLDKGEYKIGAIGEDPSCSIPAHNQLFKAPLTPAPADK